MKTPVAVKLPSGQWRCQVTISGQRVSVTRPTKKEAEKIAAEIKLGTEKIPKPITLRDAYAQYIESKRGVLSPATIASYSRMSRNYFQSLMGRRIDAITSDAIQREVSALAESGLSPKTIGNAHALFISVMRQYWSDYTDRVTLPQKQKYEQRAVTADEIKLILLAVKGTEIELPVLCGLWLGMRMSEIRGAMVEDVEGNILHIRRAIVDAENGEPVVKGTKTTAGARDLPLPEYILGLLPEEGYFTRLSGQSIYKRFSRLCEQKGIRHLRFHDLRHANAAVMVRLGIDSKYAQERNGWTTDYMYRQQYAYIMGDKMQQVTKQIDDYFSHELLTK